MKIDLKTKNKNRNIKYKKIFLSVLFSVFVFSLVLNIFLKVNNFYSLKKDYEKLGEIAGVSNDFQDKYNKKREEILKKKNNQSNWGMILYEIYSKLPIDIFITKISYNNNQIYINGITKTKNNIFMFSEELKKLNFCSEVFVDDIQNGSDIFYKINILLSK